MSDRVVYVCGCGVEGGSVFDDGLWAAKHVGRKCASCSQPVTAINIDHLLRIEAAAKAWYDARRAGHVYIREADALYDAIKDAGHRARKEGG